MQEIILIRYFERGLSKNLKKINSISSFEPSPFRLQNKFKPLLVMDYMTKFDDVI